MFGSVVLEDDDVAVEAGVKIPAMVVSFVEFAHHRVEPLLPKDCVAIHYVCIRDTDIKYGAGALALSGALFTKYLPYSKNLK